MLFENVQIGDTFECNGNLYLKKSTRTGELLDIGRTFYFTKKDQVKLKSEFDFNPNQLRAKGYCVVIFTPKELRGADPSSVEDRLVELGNEVIDYLGN